MSQTYDLTQGKVSSVIMRFFFPMLFANMLQQVYTVSDTVIVGKGLGDDALAAVGNMSSLTFLVIGFSMGLANGFSVSIAQSFGAKNYRKLRRVIASSAILSIIIGIILTVLSVSFLKPVLTLLQTDALIMNDSLTYGYIIFGGLITTIFYNLCSGILRALGDSKTPLAAIIVSSILNIVLNCLSIYTFNMGIGGAAIATIISQLVSAVICYIRLRKIDIIHLSRQDFAPDAELYTELFKNGLPMALMNSITAVGCMVVQYFVNGLGVAHTSAYSACSKYVNLFMQPACTAGFAMSAFTSQNCGAQNYERIRNGLHTCLKLAFVSYLISTAAMCFFPEILASFMLNGNDRIELAVQFLPICGLAMFGVDFLYIFRSGCQGMGCPMIPMISGIVEMVMRISVIVTFIPHSGFKATAYAEAVAWFAALALNFCAFMIILRKRLCCDKHIFFTKKHGKIVL